MYIVLTSLSVFWPPGYEGNDDDVVVVVGGGKVGKKVGVKLGWAKVAWHDG